MDEGVAEAILRAALREGRSAELLTCLFEGGSATVDPEGHLVLASADAIRGLLGHG